MHTYGGTGVGVVVVAGVVVVGVVVVVSQKMDKATIKMY